MRTRLGSRWAFGLADVDDSTEEDKQIRVPQSWDDVVRAAEESPSPNLPANFLKKTNLPTALLSLRSLSM